MNIKVLIDLKLYTILRLHSIFFVPFLKYNTHSYFVLISVINFSLSFKFSSNYNYLSLDEDFKKFIVSNYPFSVSLANVNI